MDGGHSRKEGDLDMSINAKVIQALNGITPCEPDEYTGSAKEYATVNYDEIGAAFGDDEAEETRYLVEIHYFAPISVNTIDKRRHIKLALRNAGFTDPDVYNITGQDRYADPVKRQHYLFECEYAGEAEP